MRILMFCPPMISRAHGVVASHPRRMRKALGSNPSVSTHFSLSHPHACEQLVIWHRPRLPFCRLLPPFAAFWGLRLLDLRTSIMLKSVALRGFCSLCVKGGFSLLFLFAALCFPVCASPASVPGIPLRFPSLPLRCFSSGKCSPAFACPPHCATACAGRLISFISVRPASRERKNSRAPLPLFYMYMLGQLMRARPDDLPRLGSGANSQKHCGWAISTK